MHQKAPAIIALETLMELACDFRPRDLELAQASFDRVLRELLTPEEWEEYTNSFREPAPPLTDEEIPF